MPKYTLKEPRVVEEDEPISVTLTQEFDGDIRIDLQRGNVKAKVLRFNRYGKVAKIMHQTKELEALGMSTNNGSIVIY
jgi:hypothetical protein